MNLLENILNEKIIAIIRGFDTETTLKTVRALKEGGIKFSEIPFSQDMPVSYTCEKISAVCASEPDVFVGAGTVLTPEQVEAACKAGAKYIIAPNSDESVIKKAKELGLLAMPGAMTPTEAVQCWKWGADIVKIFPSGALGIPYIKALKEPLGHIPLFAVGGVNLDNVRDFLKAGMCGAGIGGNLANKNLIASGDFAAITELAREYVKNVQGIL